RRDRRLEHGRELPFELQPHHEKGRLPRGIEAHAEEGRIRRLRHGLSEATGRTGRREFDCSPRLQRAGTKTKLRWSLLAVARNPKNLRCRLPASPPPC